MKIEFDPVKREKTLAERKLDFLDAPKVFAGKTLTIIDDRADYGELRHITYGWLHGRARSCLSMSRGKECCA